MAAELDLAPRSTAVGFLTVFSFCGVFHDFDFCFGQAACLPRRARRRQVEITVQPVNLRVGDGDLAFEQGFLRQCAYGDPALAQPQPLLHVFQPLIAAGLVVRRTANGRQVNGRE